MHKGEQKDLQIKVFEAKFRPCIGRYQYAQSIVMHLHQIYRYVKPEHKMLNMAEDVISILENCENLQYLYILGCKEVKLLPITTAMKNWYQEAEVCEKKRKLQKLKKIVMTRCIGGKRHSLLIKKVLEDIQLLKYHQQQHEEF
ncbi:19115_t:CDS:2, partial [Racocetra fulgida]